MDNTTAYMVIVFSPILYIQLQLNLRYSIVYSKIRRLHSKSFIKKNKGSFVEMLFMKHFKGDIGLFWYSLNFVTLVLTMLSLTMSIIYLVLWISGHQIQAVWVPWTWVYLDIVCSLLYLVKHTYDKLVSR